MATQAQKMYLLGIPGSSSSKGAGPGLRVLLDFTLSVALCWPWGSIVSVALPRETAPRPKMICPTCHPFSLVPWSWGPELFSPLPAKEAVSAGARVFLPEEGKKSNIY